MMRNVRGAVQVEERTGTRARILEACRELFNRRGPAEVTTAEIAASVGISEGNLHYHFRRKEQIVTALFDAFEAAIARVASDSGADDAGDAPLDRDLNAWFNLMWEWRFLYAAGVYRLSPGLQPRLKVISDANQARIRARLHELRAAGRLAATSSEIDRLVVNAWIVASYWIDYLRTRQGIEPVTREHIRWGFAQVRALFVPYLVVQAPLFAVRRQFAEG